MILSFEGNLLSRLLQHFRDTCIGRVQMVAHGFAGGFGFFGVQCTDDCAVLFECGSGFAGAGQQHVTAAVQMGF